MPLLPEVRGDVHVVFCQTYCFMGHQVMEKVSMLLDRVDYMLQSKAKSSYLAVTPETRINSSL